MNISSLCDSTQTFDRLEVILRALSTPREDFTHTFTHGDTDSHSRMQGYSTHFNEHVIDILRELIVSAHGETRRKRKGGGFYIEEHTVELMELGLYFRVPPCVVFAYGVHDYDEDNKQRLAFATKKKNLRHLNRGTLEQQILELSPKKARRPHISRADRNIILNVSNLMTKPTDDELNDCISDFEDRRFVGKVFGVLGEPYWNRQVSGNSSVNETQKFYAQLGVLLDMYSNGNSDEIPEEDCPDAEKFLENQKRNTLRLAMYGKMLDESVRRYPEMNHIIFDRRAYDGFRIQHLIPRIVKGVKKFNLELSDAQRRYWGL